MKKLLIASPLVFASFILAYGAWASWEQLTKSAVLVLGVAIGACLAAAIMILFWRPAHPATRHQASLPSPWERGRWR